MTAMRTDITANSPSATGADPQHELLQLLRLANAQLTCCLQEGAAAMHSVTKTYTSMAATIEAMRQAAEQLTDSPAQAEIHRACLAAMAEQQHAVGALQFYDRVAQRLAHVADNLTALSTKLEDGGLPWQAADWQALCETIQSSFTMEAEHRLFEAIRSGASVQQAISSANCCGQEHDTELF